MKFIGEKKIILEKVPTVLDNFVIKSVKILENYTKYVIVSGYVSILFGRSRATEDIDIIIEYLNKNRFFKLYEALEENGFWCINKSTKESAFEDMQLGDRPRFALKPMIIPNMELELATSDLKLSLLDDNIKVFIDNSEIKISPIELQIAYKELILGSDKDLEDAKHLEVIFKDKIDNQLLNYYRRSFKK